MWVYVAFQFGFVVLVAMGLAYGVFLEGWQGKNCFDSAWFCSGSVCNGVFSLGYVVSAYSLK